ncbi:MAG: cation diffusion facilitator family transporter [Anaerovoracaceae bacterium]|jgi:cation diffusion facilitator family transporter
MNRFLIRRFIPDCDRVQDPAVRENYGRLAGIAGIITNLIACTIKIAAGLLAGSIAVVADGINNLTDASSSILTLIGFRMAGKPEDQAHPYGHARAEYITGLLIAVIIVFAGFMLLRSSIDKILHPQALAANWLTLAALIVAIALKVWQYQFYRYAAARIDSLTLRAAATDSRNDIIATCVVLAGILIAQHTGLLLDGWLGCGVAAFVIWSGIDLIGKTISPLLGESPDPELVRRIAEMARSHEGVLGIHDLVVHNYGPGRIFASMHVEVDADGDLMESHDMIDNLEREIEDTLHIEFVVHMDPVRRDDPRIQHIYEALRTAFADREGIESIHDLRIVPGPTHTNVVFDVVLAPGCPCSEHDIHALATAAVRRLDPDYYVVITFDHAYTKL